MFKKWGQDTGDDAMNMQKENIHGEGIAKKSNTILKGSKLTGDITVTCDLELSGDIEGNITSGQDSSIVIKGACKGNIDTKEGDVMIEGSLDGSITAGRDVRISGRFRGGDVKTKGRILVDGEFDGAIEGSEIEIGPHAKGHGELLYREHIQISRGANIEGHISKLPAELKLVDNKPATKEKVIDASALEINGAN